MADGELPAKGFLALAQDDRCKRPVNAVGLESDGHPDRPTHRDCSHGQTRYHRDQMGHGPKRSPRLAAQYVGTRCSDPENDHLLNGRPASPWAVAASAAAHQLVPGTQRIGNKRPEPILGLAP
jgi:hypothetical protein